MNEVLEIEAARGEKYGRAWEELVEPFFEAKQLQLYEAFKELPTSNNEGLVILKMQSNALESLKDEFQHHINTGKLAKQTLEEEESNE